MNYLVYLDPHAGELEKILSGTKSMLLKEFDPPCAATQVISPGDSLYFLRNESDCDLHVLATVLRVLAYSEQVEGDLSNILKEMQPRLQLTEDQYYNWSVKGQFLLVEFGAARKIDVIHVAPENITHRFVNGSRWIAFEMLVQVTCSDLPRST